jgi:hypothetical protein
MPLAIAVAASLVAVSIGLTPLVRPHLRQCRDRAALSFFIAVQTAVVSVAFLERPWITVAICGLALELAVLSGWLAPTRGSRWADFEREFRAWVAERETASQR